GAAGDVRRDPQRRRLFRERDDRRARLRRRAGQADVRAVDAELVHQPEQADLDLEGRVADGWALEPVAQRLVVELDGSVVRARDPAVTIPVVDERVEVAHRTGTPIGRAATTRPFSHARSVISAASTPVWREALKR